MIRTAAIIATLFLAGCAGRGTPDVPVGGGDVSRDISGIYLSLPEDLSSSLTLAERRFAALSDAQIDQLMFSVLQTIGCTVSTNELERNAQYSVFGFSALRSVRLDLEAYENWALESDDNDAEWSRKKLRTGQELQRRAGRSLTESAFFVKDDDGLVTGLSTCGGIDGL